MAVLSRNLVAYSKDLRAKQTPWEQILWKHLRAKHFGVKFKRQVVIGPYIFDFGAKQQKILIELDGYAHKGEGKIKDKQKIEFANNMGYVVLKFWNSEIEKDLEKVLNTIQDALNH